MIPGKIPSVEIQEEYVEKIIQAIHDAEKTKDIVLFFDPMHQVHNSKTGYAWQLKGKEGTKAIPSNTGRKRVNILGALNPTDLQTVTVMTEDNCDKYMILLFLNEVRKAYIDAPKITIFLDNAPYNKAYEVQDEAEELGIVLEFLPSYSPNLNLIERLWKFSKKILVRNAYHPTFEEFKEAVYNFLRNIGEYREKLEKLITLKFQIIKAS